MKTKLFRRLLSGVAAAMVSSAALFSQDGDPALSTQLREGYFATDEPQAWTLPRHGDMNAALHTGAVGFTIPFYTYSDHDFEIPMNFLYSSAGFQPGSDPGVLGNGWHLECGGTITREVRGIPDECRNR